MALARSGVVSRPRTIDWQQRLLLQVVGGRRAGRLLLVLALLIIVGQEARLGLVAAAQAAVEVRRQQARPLAEGRRRQAVHRGVSASRERGKWGD